MRYALILALAYCFRDVVVKDADQPLYDDIDPFLIYEPDLKFQERLEISHCMDKVQAYFQQINSKIWDAINKYSSAKYKTKCFRKLAADATLACIDGMNKTEYDSV